MYNILCVHPHYAFWFFLGMLLCILKWQKVLSISTPWSCISHLVVSYKLKMPNLTQISMSSMLTPFRLPQKLNRWMQKTVKVAKVLWLITYWELEEKEGLLINLSFHAPYYTIVNWIELNWGTCKIIFIPIL